MKTFAITLLLISGFTAALLAEPIIKFEIKYENVHPKWFSDLNPKDQESIFESQGGVITLPSVSVREGKDETIEMIREYRSTPKGAVVPCGVIVDLGIELRAEIIVVTGKSVFRRPTNKDVNGVATRFEAQEVLINVELRNGKPKTIDLEDGGQMIVTPILIDAAGNPIKN